MAYIVFHLGSTLEAYKNISEKVTAILYCPSHYDANVKLADIINRLTFFPAVRLEKRDFGVFAMDHAAGKKQSQ